MENLKLDKDYNILEEKNVYSDGLIENVELIKKAQFENIITDTQASFLMKIILKREFKNEARTILPFTDQNPQIFSLFMNMKNKQVKHV